MIYGKISYDFKLTSLLNIKQEDYICKKFSSRILSKSNVVQI